MRELETERLRLRPLAPEDRDALYVIYADREVRRDLLTQPRSIEEFRQPFQQMVELSSTLGMWVVISKADNRMIGRCGFYLSPALSACGASIGASGSGPRGSRLIR